MSNRVVWMCAALSLVAHAMAASMWHPMDRSVRGGRTSAASVWTLGQPVSTSPSTLTAKQAKSHRPTGSKLSAGPTSAERSDPVEPQRIDGPARETAPSTELPAKPIAATNTIGDAEGWSDYIPRPQLSMAPVAQRAILIEAPPGQQEPRRISGVLSIFINEYGVVDHIVPTGSDMPPEFEKAAIAAFRGMTYSPGQLQGQAVKSRIRVEVVFDNTPLEDLALGPPQP